MCDHDLMSTELSYILNNCCNLDMFDTRAVPYYGQAAFGLTSF